MLFLTFSAKSVETIPFSIQRKPTWAIKPLCGFTGAHGNPSKLSFPDWRHLMALSMLWQFRSPTHLFKALICMLLFLTFSPFVFFSVRTIFCFFFAHAKEWKI